MPYVRELLLNTLYVACHIIGNIEYREGGETRSDIKCVCKLWRCVIRGKTKKNVNTKSNMQKLPVQVLALMKFCEYSSNAFMGMLKKDSMSGCVFSLLLNTSQDTTVVADTMTGHS